MSKIAQVRSIALYNAITNKFQYDDYAPFLSGEHKSLYAKLSDRVATLSDMNLRQELGLQEGDIPVISPKDLQTAVLKDAATRINNATSILSTNQLSFKDDLIKETEETIQEFLRLLQSNKPTKKRFIELGTIEEIQQQVLHTYSSTALQMLTGGGMLTHDYCIITGVYAHGKSYFSNFYILKEALKTFKADEVLFISLEGNPSRIALKLRNFIRQGFLSGEEIHGAKIDSDTLKIFNAGDYKVPDLKSLVTEINPKLIIFDNIPKASQTREYEEIMKISSYLSSLAQETGICVFGIAQADNPRDKFKKDKDGLEDEVKIKYAEGLSEDTRTHLNVRKIIDKKILTAFGDRHIELWKTNVEELSEKYPCKILMNMIFQGDSGSLTKYKKV